MSADAFHVAKPHVEGPGSRWRSPGLSAAPASARTGSPEIDDCVVVAAGWDHEVRAIVLVHLRSGHGTDGILARANEILSGLDKPLLAELRAVEMESTPVGVTGKVLKRRLREAYAAATADEAVHSC